MATKSKFQRVRSAGSTVSKIIPGQRAFIWLGALSTFLFYNPSKFSYWEFVIKGNRIDLQALKSLELESLAPLLWIALGAIMIGSASWLLIKAWEALTSKLDKILALGAAAFFIVLLLILGVKDAIIENPLNSVYLLYTAFTVIIVFAMIAKRAELGVFKVRTTSHSDHDEEKLLDGDHELE